MLLLHSLSLHQAMSSCLVFFDCTLQDSLHHILQGRSNGHKLAQLLFFWEFLISPLFLKDSFIHQPTSLWPPKFLLRNWLIILLRILICKLFLSCYIQESLCVTFKTFDFNTSQYGSLWIYLTWCLLSFLNVHLHLFYQIRKFSAIVSFNIFLLWLSQSVF